MPRASVNGLDMYYEIRGEGQPLVLLHGSLSGIGTSFGALLPGLARSRRVIAVEQQAHGRTPDIDRPLSIEQMAEDTAALLRHLDIERADVFGWSLGAGIALQFAIAHPELLRKLVLASVTYDRAGSIQDCSTGSTRCSPRCWTALPGSRSTPRSRRTRTAGPRCWRR
jgi:pimeloyl-ACP methyl ester carboxylesterase